MRLKSALVTTREELRTISSLVIGMELLGASLELARVSNGIRVTVRQRTAGLDGNSKPTEGGGHVTLLLNRNNFR